MTNNTQFSSRQVPWMIHHATVVDDAVTAEEAIQMAGLDFEVKLVQDGYKSPVTGNWKVDKTKRKVVRVDTDTPLGTVSPTYEHLPYAEAFDFMNEISPEYVAAGSLKGGRQAFVVVKVPEHFELPVLDGEDPHDLYAVLRSSLDGSKPVELSILPLRDKCTNMMTLPSFGKDAPQRWSVRHTKNMRIKLDEARRVITNLDGYAEEYKRTAERLANMDLTLEEARDIIGQSVPEYVKTDRERDAIFDVYQNSTRNGYKGTAWGVLNAVTEHYDWYRGGDDRNPETRWVQGLDGATSKAIDRTLKLLTR